MRIITLLILGFIFNYSASANLLPNKVYRGQITRPDQQQIIFNFDVQEKDGKQVLYIWNGDERMLVDNISAEKDSIIIQLPFYESSFRVKKDKSGNLEGIWIKRLADRDQVLPFRAQVNNKTRFASRKKAAKNIEGRWAVKFIRESSTSTGIGEFEQEGNRLTGSFLTSSGDYRYLEGIVYGDSLVMSGFDGGFALLFKAKIEDDGKISGGYLYSGAGAPSKWEAVKDANAALPDEFEQTHLREGESELNFAFEDLNGNKVSIKDDRFKGKVVVVQILGSWCPNCIDETRYLIELYEKYNRQGLEMVALSYERTAEKERSIAALKRLQEKLKIPYPVLWTGVSVSDPQKTEKTLPQIDNIKVFPTSIIIGKDGKVRKIHTGFSGPGTGVHYVEHKKVFEKMMQELLSEG
jgi:thiol-disulfide isomerase/thioredoxin